MESQTPGNRNEPTSVARTFTEMESALGSLLESVLFLALLVQIAAALVYLPGGNISQYEGTLIMYTAMIPVSPVLTLINTPGFLKAIRLRKFHLAITILVVGLAGGVIFRGTEDLLSNEAKLDKAVAENKPDPFRCGSSFLMRIMPAAFEAKILRCFWVLAAVGLIFAVDLYVGIRNEEKDANGGGGEGATIEEREPTKQTRKTASVVFWTLYFPVYVGLQFLQFFLLSRIYWMRKMVYNIINPNIAVKYEADIGKYHDQFVTARNDWADDKWGFGQIMSLSLWLPTIMEMVYLIISMPPLFQPVLYVQLANGGLATIIGEERWFTKCRHP